MSKKILLKGMLAISTTVALTTSSLLLLSDFEDNQIKAEFLKKDIQSSENLNGVYFETIGGKKYSTNDLIENKISGAFLHPYKDGEIMVVSFQDDKKSKLKTDESRHKKITEDLIELGRYNSSESEAFKLKESKMNQTFKYSHQEVDYNAISISVSQIKLIQESLIEEGFSQKTAEKVGRTVIYHELAHSHNREDEKKHKLIKAFEKQKSKEDIDLLYKEVAVKELYHGENYADSFSLLVSARDDIRMHNSSFEDFNKYSTFLKDYYRKTTEEITQFNRHETRATIETTSNFIKKNWDIIGEISVEDLENIARIITNKTLNNVLVKNYNNSYENQQKLAKNKGYSEEEIKMINKDVEEGMKDLFINKIVNGEFKKEVNQNKLDSLIEELDKKEEKKRATEFKFK